MEANEIDAIIAKWDPEKRKRYETLVETIEYYMYLTLDNRLLVLTGEQLDQIAETRDRLYCFGEPGKNWVQMANEILQEQSQM